jgi:hypothetical protein
MTTAYQELLDRTKQLSSEERLRLADTLLAEELGFGMWPEPKNAGRINIEKRLRYASKNSSGTRHGFH